MKTFDDAPLRLLPHSVTLSLAAETSSTNDDLKVVARGGAPDYTLRIADRQIAGRGRKDHSFHSEGGLYMSILLPVREEIVPYLTPIAAVAVTRALCEIARVNARIKWVNDVYVDGRKVSGILSESVVTAAGRRYIVGIGVNLRESASSFPEEIREIAGWVAADRSTLAARILTHLFALLDEGDLERIRREYRDYSFLIGSEVIVHQENGCREATVLGLTDTLALSVLYRDGSKEDLIAGEVSIRSFDSKSS